MSRRPSSQLLARAAALFAAKPSALCAAGERGAALTASSGCIPGELPGLIGALALRAAVFGAHGVEVAS